MEGICIKHYLGGKIDYDFVIRRAWSFLMEEAQSTNESLCVRTKGWDGKDRELLEKVKLGREVVH